MGIDATMKNEEYEFWGEPVHTTVDNSRTVEGFKKNLGKKLKLQKEGVLVPPPKFNIVGDSLVAVGKLVAQRPQPGSVRAARSRHGGTLASGDDAKTHSREITRMEILLSHYSLKV
jgi:hypothetical protein